MLRCKKGTIYTGITTDLERRMNEHFNKDEKCAKYTLSNPATKLEIAWESETRVLASKLEYHIKRLPKKSKEELIKDSSKMKVLLKERIDFSDYKIYQGVSI